MPSSQVINTPYIIQKAWNDGLFNLRERRNGKARGSSIEEKAMYVLGIGWKFSGNTEVKDQEIEGTLFVSLQGLTQDAKFMKIGQVLWEQCDEAFILKMITSLTNNTPEQKRIYQQISVQERQNFKKYFSKVAMGRITKQGLNAHGILNRESRQMMSSAGLNQRHQQMLETEKKRLAQSQINSKKIEKRVVQFRPGSAETRQLAKELTVILRTIEANNIAEIAMNLGIEVETGYHKRFLVEEIIAVTTAYVDRELLLNKSGANGPVSNVYLRQGTKGLDTIKRLLKYTHFGLMVSDDDMSLDDLRNLDKNIKDIQDKMNLGKKKGGRGEFSLRRFDRSLRQKDAFLDAVTRSESGDLPKVKANEQLQISRFLRDKLGTGNEGNFSYAYKKGRRVIVKGENPGENDNDAIDKWMADNKDLVSMANSIVGSGVTGTERHGKLRSLRYTTDELLEQLIILSTSMGIDRTALSRISAEYPYMGVGTPGIYALAIFKRLLAVQKEGNRFGVLGFGRRRRKSQLKDIMAKVDSNVESAIGAKKKDDAKFAKGPDGIFRPLSVEPKRLKDYFARMQPVYVVGGSVYSFGANGSALVGEGAPSVKSIVEKTNKKNRLISRGSHGVRAAYKMSEMGYNMGAHGTIEAPLEQGENESDAVYMRRVVEAKMMKELQDKGMRVKPDIQPVFLVNKGINTSNIEATALLNLLPNVLSLIPGIGTAAGAAVDGILQGEINAAKNLPKFAVGGSFTTRNTNVSQFISGDSINNKINPERVTIDWARQRVNVQPLNTTNNITNVEKGRITDPIMGTPTTVTVPDKMGKPTEAINVVNAVNPFNEKLTAGGMTGTPMELIYSLKESLVAILESMNVSGQINQANATMTAKVVDAITNLDNTMRNNNNTSSGSGKQIFSPGLGKLARGE